jgi:ubiquinone/menaquinone biosynthesis C-methylase UbiE
MPLRSAAMRLVKATTPFSREMLNIARQRAAKLSMDVSFSLADAAALPFSDRSFDTLGIERKQIHWVALQCIEE